MKEPFMMPSPDLPPEGTYFINTHIEFKTANRSIVLIPMNISIISGDRACYTVQECEADTSIWKSAVENTANIDVTVNTDGDFVSIRSARSEDTPCGALLLLPGKNRRTRLLRMISEKLRQKKMPDAQDHYFIFITPDEILLADKSKFKLTVVRKTIKNIRNRLTSTDPGLLLSTEVLEYDADEDVYKEV